MERSCANCYAMLTVAVICQQQLTASTDTADTEVEPRHTIKQTVEMINPLDFGNNMTFRVAPPSS